MKVKPQKNLRSTTWAISGSTAASSSSAWPSRSISSASSGGPASPTSLPSIEVISKPPPRFLRLAAAEAVDDQAAHDPRRIGEEPGAVGEGHPLALRDVEIGLVEQAGDAERGARPRARELAAGEPAKLPVERREERLGRLAVAAIGGEDQSREGKLPRVVLLAAQGIEAKLAGHAAHPSLAALSLSRFSLNRSSWTSR